MKIQDFINDFDKYKVDLNYQRPTGAWSREDEQCLIDTILRKEPMPMFFLNYNVGEEVYYIVDGQQRLHTIRKFYNNKIKLNKKFSGIDNQGKRFNKINPLSKEQKKIFLNYELNFHILNDYSDEKIRLIFSRLQRGKALSLGELLNALPGRIVESMRNIAKHKFMANSIDVVKERYGNYPDSARILFYEKYGVKQCNKEDLIRFFDEFKDLESDSVEYKNALNVLNFLLKCFPYSEGEYSFLSKHTWVYSVYVMVRDLKKIYSLHGLEMDIKKYIRSFHANVYNPDFRRSNLDYQIFFDCSRGGFSEELIRTRNDILIKEFLKQFKDRLKKFDFKRQISEQEKISKYSVIQNCEMCNDEIFDYKKAHYHHNLMYKNGGKSKIDNIVILCKKCHKIIHGKEKIKPLELNSEIENGN